MVSKYIGRLGKRESHAFSSPKLFLTPIIQSLHTTIALILFYRSMVLNFKRTSMWRHYVLQNICNTRCCNKSKATVIYVTRNQLGLLITFSSVIDIVFILNSTYLWINPKIVVKKHYIESEEKSLVLNKNQAFLSRFNKICNLFKTNKNIANPHLYAHFGAQRIWPVWWKSRLLEYFIIAIKSIQLTVQTIEGVQIMDRVWINEGWL